MPIKIILYILKEIQRVYKINHGVVHAAKLYPNAYLIHIVIGTAKGAGSGIIKIFEQVIFFLIFIKEFLAFTRNLGSFT